MNDATLIVVVVIFIMSVSLVIHMLTSLKKVRQICKRHIWREFLVEMPNSEDNTKVLYCEICGILPSSDLENPSYIEIYKK